MPDKNKNRYKNKNRKRFFQQQVLQKTPDQPVEMMPMLDMGYLNAATVMVNDFDSVEIVLVGCGGTGSFLAMHIARIIRVLYEMGKGFHFTLIDPDIVEQKNTYRQLFCDAEIGTSKAEALARRYGLAWGVNTSYAIDRFDEKYLNGADITLLVGYVDNAAGRQALSAVFAQNADAAPFPPGFWYLDCGNLKDTGRVLLGSAQEVNYLAGAFPEPDICAALPSPTLQYPDLLRPLPEELECNAMSCAEMLAANIQSLNINSRIASEASDMITRLLVTRDLKRFACEVNTAAGSVKSYYTTPEEVARVIHKPVEFLKAPAWAETQAATA